MATVALICQNTEWSIAALKLDSRGFKMSYLRPPSVKYKMHKVSLIQHMVEIDIVTVAVFSQVMEWSIAARKLDIRGFKMSYLQAPSVKYTLNTVKLRILYLKQ